MQLMDPTIMGRDPSFDPIAMAFDAGDPSGNAFFRIPPQVGGLTTGRRLARPAYWEQLGTITGRRLRDSFMPGSGVLSLDVLKKMHDYEVCELDGQPSTNPSGLDALGQRVGGQCIAFTGNGPSALKPPATTSASSTGASPACRPAYFGGPTICGPQLAGTLSRASPRR
jgi:hypothetical protein